MKLKQPQFKCQSCNEIVDQWDNQRELCEECYLDHGKELDELLIQDTLRRRGFEWCIRALTKEQ
jgi:Zn finger protein HypA/HybF involved in hydrogenase expression